MSMTNTTIREVNIASNVTVGDKICHVRSLRPMLLLTATVDGAKIADERDGRRQDAPYALREADVAVDCDGRRSKDCGRTRRSATRCALCAP
jgi:hypothetical protein